MTAKTHETAAARTKRIKAEGFAKDQPATATPTPEETPVPTTPTDKPAPVKAVKPVKPAPANCACGCGAPTVTAKAVFLSGHDARHAGSIGRLLAANPTDKPALDALARMTPKLQEKALSVKATADRKAATKTAAAKAKTAAKAAYDTALAEALVTV